MMILPVAFVPSRQLPGRARPLLGDDEPVDGRPGSRHAPAGAEEASGAAEALVEDAAEERGREGRRRRRAEAQAAPASAALRRQPRPSASMRREQEEGRRGDDRGSATGRGDGGDRRRGEVGGPARAREAPPGPRKVGGSLPGRLRGRARLARGRVRAGAGDCVGRLGLGRRRARRDEAESELAARCESSSSGSRAGSASAAGSTSWRTTRPDRVVLRLEPRTADRQARTDDRRDPVPRERDRLALAAGRPKGRRRGRRRVSGTPPRGARVARGSKRGGGARDAFARSSSSR